jgi:hypothetical protein
LEADDWHKNTFQNELRREQICLYAAGQWDQMLGYVPGQQTGDDGEPTGDAVTGVHEDTMTFPYFTFRNPVVYVALWAEADCTLKGGRMFWHLESEGS